MSDERNIFISGWFTDSFEKDKRRDETPVPYVDLPTDLRSLGEVVAFWRGVKAGRNAAIRKGEA